MRHGRLSIALSQLAVVATAGAVSLGASTALQADMPAALSAEQSQVRRGEGRQLQRPKCQMPKNYTKNAQGIEFEHCLRTSRFLRLVREHGVQQPKFEEVWLTAEEFPKLAFAVPALRISWSSSTFFDSNRDDLMASAEPIIELVADAIARDIGDVNLFLVGHTDAIGNAAYNEDLSLRRAQHVAEMLAARGVPERQMTIAGVGFRQPVATNFTESGRALNRRVEFMLAAFSEVNFELVERREVNPEFFSVPERKPLVPPVISEQDQGVIARSPPDLGQIVVFDVRKQVQIRTLDIPPPKAIGTLPKRTEDRETLR